MPALTTVSFRLDAQPDLVAEWRGAKLYQGGASVLYDAAWFRDHPVSLLVLAAEEVQPPKTTMAGLVGMTIWRLKLDDVLNPLSPQAAKQVLLTAAVVADSLDKGHNVLVTCAMGLNRSGLINAVAIRMLTGAPAGAVIRAIRRRRGGALTNATFNAFISGLSNKQLATWRQVARDGG